MDVFFYIFIYLKTGGVGQDIDDFSNEISFNNFPIPEINHQYING